MLRLHNYYLLCLFISSPLIFGACIPFQKSLQGTLPSRSIFETGISDKEIPAEIERLKNLTEDKTGKAVSIDVYLRLAVLYSSYRNEDPDYISALTALEKYMAVYSGWGNEPEVKTLHALLLRIRHLSDNKELEKLRSSNRTLIKKNKAITKQNEELIVNNEALKETIKKLGRIDLKLEQKRKSYK